MSTARFLKAVGIVFAVAIVAAASGDTVPAGTTADIMERTRPLGRLCLEGEACETAHAAQPGHAALTEAQTGGRTGIEVYDTFCLACHATGLNEAPKLGDEEAWRPRVAKGMEALLATTKTGLDLMPPMGICMDCSDDELRAAISHMSGMPMAEEDADEPAD